MKGIVYKAYCLKTLKCYIGITIVSLNKRKSLHFNDAFNANSNVHFHRALRKYGKQYFEWSILDSIECTTKESLIECLKALEIKYIKLYNSYKEGYNSTPGGDYISDCSKGVKVFTSDGLLYKCFDSRREAGIFFGISEDAVSSGCLRKLKFSLINNQRYIFRDLNDDFTESEISELKLIKHNPQCVVLAFDTVTLEVIGVFNTIKEGAKFIGLKSASPICEILNGSSKRKTAGKYNGHKVGWIKL